MSAASLRGYVDYWHAGWKPALKIVQCQAARPAQADTSAKSSFGTNISVRRWRVLTNYPMDNLGHEPRKLSWRGLGWSNDPESTNQVFKKIAPQSPQCAMHARRSAQRAQARCAMGGGRCGGPPMLATMFGAAFQPRAARWRRRMTLAWHRPRATRDANCARASTAPQSIVTIGLEVSGRPTNLVEKPTMTRPGVAMHVRGLCLQGIRPKSARTQTQLAQTMMQAARRLRLRSAKPTAIRRLPQARGLGTAAITSAEYHKRRRRFQRSAK